MARKRRLVSGATLILGMFAVAPSAFAVCNNLPHLLQCWDGVPWSSSYLADSALHWTVAESYDLDVVYAAAEVQLDGAGHDFHDDDGPHNVSDGSSGSTYALVWDAYTDPGEYCLYSAYGYVADGGAQYQGFKPWGCREHT